MGAYARVIDRRSLTGGIDMYVGQVGYLMSITHMGLDRQHIY
jgi:hypothetical protein